MELIGLKLTSGDELVGYYLQLDEQNSVLIGRPMRLIFTQENAIMLQPYMTYAAVDSVWISIEHIICQYDVKPEMKKIFDKVWGSMDDLLSNSLKREPGEEPQKSKAVAPAKVFDPAFVSLQPQKYIQ